MSYPSNKPTVLLVQGLWHRPAHYTPLVNLLGDRGFKVIAPALPSTGGELQHGLHSDAHTIEKIIEDLVNAEEDVLIVAHSDNRGVETPRDEESQSRTREKGRSAGNRFHRCVVFTPGQTLLGALGGSFPPFTPVDGQGKLVMLHSKERFVYDSPPKETEEWLELLAPVSVTTHTDQVKNCGWLYVPNLYIYTTDDKAIVQMIQKKMVHAAKVFGGEFVEETMEGGQSPLSTQPDAVANIILKHLDAGRWAISWFSDEEAKVQEQLLGEGLQKIGAIMMELGEIPGGRG